MNAAVTAISKIAVSKGDKRAAFSAAVLLLSREPNKGPLAALLDSLAEKEETTKTEIVRRALSIMKAYREQSSVGRTHIGFTADPTKLDAELIGILSSPDSGVDHAGTNQHD